MKKIFKIPFLLPSQASFIEKAREAFAPTENEEFDNKLIEYVILNFNHSAKLIDRYTFFSYIFAATFYFVVHGYIKINNIGFVEVINENTIPSIFPFLSLFLTSVALLHFIYANKIYILLETFASERHNGLFVDKLFIFSLNLTSFTFVCESSRYNKFSLLHCLRHLIVFAFFLTFVFGPYVILWDLYAYTLDKIDEKILSYYKYISYGLLIMLIIFTSVIFVMITDALGKKRAK